MKRQQVVFYLNMFLSGGIETSLLEYLNNLEDKELDITLLIGIKLSSKTEKIKKFRYLYIYYIYFLLVSLFIRAGIKGYEKV